MTSVAVYVHVPWCASLCPYCDFDKQAHDFRLVDEYIDAIIRHIEDTPPRRAHSLYLGGGTPSLLTAPRLARIVDACRARFELPTDAEVTLEANPSDVVAHKIEAYLQAGMTRLSLGIQSLDDDELRFLGRRHTADKARRSFAAARAAGCDNISVDLMYGLPGQTTDRLASTLQGLVDLGPNHVSGYGLSIEEGTPMADAVARGRTLPIDDDTMAERYEEVRAALAAGYQQYELSNWARPGRESVHNLTYWRNGEWLGFGPGAAGSFMGARYKRTPDVRAYVAAARRGEAAYSEYEPSTRSTTMRDTIMLGLRLMEGVSADAFDRRFGVPLDRYCTERLPALVQAGLLCWEGRRLRLDPSAYFVSNAVLAEILPQKKAPPLLRPEEES